MVVTLSVRMLASVPPGPSTNRAIVTSPDESTSECTVSLQGIACGQSPPNNYDERVTPGTRSVNLAIVKTADREMVNPGNELTYTLTIDNLGPSDATAAATVTDVLPAPVAFASFGALPAGVACQPPVGQVVTCTVANGVLEVADVAVGIPIRVTASTVPASGTTTNRAIVTSPDDVAPCTTAPDGITCTRPTDDASEVTVALTLVESAVVASQRPAAPFPFSGSTSGRLVQLGMVIFGLGLVSVMLLLGGARRSDRANRRLARRGIR